ncbi:MAG: UDP-N-acetylmuramate dehydrogenase [Deltaproteobacteria bacterium]|nr:UDP-N-acetylmuramate dehydrogenase [Deltaproteobacteria bacterium]
MMAGSSKNTLSSELKSIAGLSCRVNEHLARYTSMKVGGPADFFIDVQNHGSLAPLLRTLSQNRVPFYLLGRGSNVLVSDLGVRGAVVRLGAEFRKVVWQEEKSAVRATLGAAYPMARLVRDAMIRGYAGLEFAEGIPGSVGGALVMNAGAYGSEMERVVERVDGVTYQGKPVSLPKEEMVFSYRNIRLPQEMIVTRVQILLSKGNANDVSRRVRDLVQIRKEKQPTGYPNSGSMFRNPPGDFAARLIEAAGLKGKKIGNASISERHANFIVNLGGAKAEEVRRLMEMAGATVKKKWGVELVPEVHFLGEWKARSAERKVRSHRT